MILQQTKNGFLRHNSLEGNKNKEQGAKNAPHKVLIPILSNCGIPNEVAPQQSFSPLPATVSIKVSLLKNYLTLSYPHSY